MPPRPTLLRGGPILQTIMDARVTPFAIVIPMAELAAATLAITVAAVPAGGYELVHVFQIQIGGKVAAPKPATRLTPIG